ncbi:MAG: 2-dehydropantoate 2-reductase [Thermodesulfobacteriota bacterium]
MRTGILGPGALGCLFGSRLFLADDKQDEILLIDHRPERAAELTEQGIIYESKDTRQRIPLPVSSSPEELGHLDTLFFCVKSHDLKNSLDFAAPLLGPSTLLIFLQNGISHLEYEQAEWLQGIPAFGTSSEGATVLTTGHIRHAGKGHTHLGFLSPGSSEESGRLRKLTMRLQNSGITSSVSPDIRSRLWGKLFINAGINGLTVIHNRPNGWLLTSETIKDEIRELVKEAETVARAMGIHISEDPFAATLTVCEKTADNISSMLQDVRRQRKTEIDAINGAISRLGRQLNIATPRNDAIVAQVKDIEKQYSE